jgi:hypothetical protein
MPARYATLVVQRERANRPFQPGAGPNGGEFFLPWRQLRDRFAQQGVELNTADVNEGRPFAFALHLTAPRALRRPAQRPCYTFLYEDRLIRPINVDRAVLANYRLVFTWNETLIDGRHILRLDYPNDLTVRDVPGWAGRDLFCVLIASNKALRYSDARSLHERRIEAIRYFESHAPDRFALYGGGWNIPAVRPGAWGRIVKRLHEWRAGAGLAGRPFPNYRGRIAGPKREVLDRARFCICYENSRGDPGYLSEKIFDCFTSGCVPVYIGTTHAEPPFPPECFIDGDRFASPREMHAFLESIDEARFAAYQRAMRDFLASPRSARFGNEHFCRTLVDTILDDLRRE